jgi:hypothetical protein
MACLEISNTELTEQIKPPFLQMVLDPFTRFEGNLNRDDDYASLYVMSSKAGAYTIRTPDLYRTEMG